MENKLFRKESVDHISSPEQLHDYLRVTSPKLWMILSAILVLLIGLVVYAFTTTMESTFTVKATAEYGAFSAEVPISVLETVKIRMPVRIDGKKGYISNIYQVTRLSVEISYDGGTVLPDDIYEFTFEESEPLPEDIDGEYLWVSIDGGKAYIPESAGMYSYLRSDRRIRIEGNLATITDAATCDTAIIDVSMDDAKYVPADGVYDMEIITETTTPMSFLLN